MRQVVLDTETTGLEPSEGHRVIEIGCVELLDRKFTGRTFHYYLNPDRKIDDGAIEVHGITNEFLVDKPRFHDIAADFIEFIRGAELVIHNAAFDVGFLNSEFNLNGLSLGVVKDYSTVLDTLLLARRLHPGQKASLDALCRRYEIDNSHRELHGALLDAEILADVYLAMTGGQTALSLEGQDATTTSAQEIRRLSVDRPKLKVIAASEEEQGEHLSLLTTIDKSSGGNCVWLKQNTA